VSLVLSPSFSTTTSIPLSAVIAILIALCGSTTATLAQKRSGGTIPLLSGTAFQYLVSGGGFLIAAIVTSGFEVQWTDKFIFSLVWLILALSVGAILILLTLLKHGSASKVSSLFYLVPPATAIEAYFLFDERLTTTDFAGIGLTALGVYLVIKNQNRAR
jgi:drug/metabolite transporter (DMT)-like permease